MDITCVTIDCTDVPIDPLLFHSLPDTQQLGGSLHEMLADLNAAGLMDCTVKLGMTKTQAVLTIYLATATCGLGALLLHQVDSIGALVILLLVACTLLLVGVLESTGTGK